MTDARISFPIVLRSVYSDFCDCTSDVRIASLVTDGMACRVRYRSPFYQPLPATSAGFQASALGVYSALHTSYFKDITTKRNRSHRKQERNMLCTQLLRESLFVVNKSILGPDCHVSSILDSGNDLIGVGNPVERMRSCKSALIAAITGESGSYLAEFSPDEEYKTSAVVRQSSIDRDDRVSRSSAA